MKIINSRNVKAVDRLLRPVIGVDRATASSVAGIVSAVRRRGDKALLSFARKFDGLDEAIEVSKDEIDEAAARVPPRVRAAIAKAANNIQRVARRQRPHACCEWRIRLAR